MAAIGVLVLGFFVVFGWAIWSRSRPRPAAAPVPHDDGPLHLEGEGDYEFDVVGEGHYQAALSEICGGKCEEGHELEVTAELRLEPDNAYDPNAVAVLIEGRLVGHLPREGAAMFSDVARRKGGGRRITCAAMIVGGWSRQRRGTIEEGSFGVKLDLDL